MMVSFLFKSTCKSLCSARLSYPFFCFFLFPFFFLFGESYRSIILKVSDKRAHKGISTSLSYIFALAILVGDCRGFCMFPKLLMEYGIISLIFFLFFFNMENAELLLWMTLFILPLA